VNTKLGYQNSSVASGVVAPFSRLATLGLRRKYAHRRGRPHEVLESFRKYLGASVLDVGAGASGPIFLSALGSGYHALDLAESYKYAGSIDRDAVEHQIDVERGLLPFPDSSFDTVMCLDVLEHVDQPHALFRELFRVSRQCVLVSLPNNWPHLIWSLLYGRNVTHRAGYGLGRVPTPAGQRHKYFFNLEEAVDFLNQELPKDFHCDELAFRFERGSDGLLATFPGLSPFFRVVGKARIQDATEHFGTWGPLVWLGAKAAYLPLRVLDFAVTAAIYGWGTPVRFYNVACRQVWAAYVR